jgi:O-antigen/teichoic acid export membrane protein
MTYAESRRAFFRQSTWMMTATVASGACMFLVHPLNSRLPPGEYSAFGTMLQLLQWLAIPAIGLQMMFAQLSAAAVTNDQKLQLHGAVRAVFKVTLGVWLVLAGLLFFVRQPLTAAWELSSPLLLWLTLAIGLMSLWIPMFLGLLQGRQNFLWMGWTTMFNGAGRVVFCYLIVLALSASALGMMHGVLLGLGGTLLLAGWHSREVWAGPVAAFHWGDWLRRLTLLTLGFGSFLFLFSADVILIKAHFPAAEMDAYVAAGTLARAIVTFTAPLAVVMFPKIVQSVAHGRQTDTLKLTLLGALVLGATAAIGLTLIAPLVFRFVFPAHVAIVPLMPWYAWAMVPLVLANVLINDLMARSRFVASPWLALVAAGYGVTLAFHHDSFKQVILILGGFNTLLLLVAACFTWQRRTSKS